MAKKGNRQIFGLICSVCKNRNYLSSKNTVNIKDKLSFKKFCKHCRRITEHSENSKLK
ncbi:50S ribosomal protein L33 [Candidatus Daviesbacteria bacterium RIFCSPHIGHO2_12_FULL_37_11]|uniref:Large ribosomal subunit protein bL33 n=1 Tax=Candidatus Daviesbacteria bacterium RIFCSPHIGHO2_12_FULL_37_11 TaxID=1797777 RepID=A0A1F5KAX4_9BACT|nr:MAG: 50S ribosomal protein L33 [Candidatus Daviesbacteria bacterium GWA1_38_6]OGE16274.1 MAG: 50S ribosomal protein L33 [Candidatus Daviesbacteria bacterium RIFCSPHIGHO2_01_FULL_37_27]OGE37935.1 MAG: 50S ribosomal protein L33 [Candidatus Daviesbacteria bacterium RIFCSPHIGHO2_12_FULL_37_11]OGE45271.1 MAG: 50S ribosomal protein L33 [Candidatus Daviesbacteria bacterium RIFCSPLOWO2_01_FULL_37_10]